VAAVAHCKQPVRRQRLQPTAQHIVSQAPRNLEIAGTQRLIEAVLLVPVLVRYLRAVPAEVEKQILLFRNASIHGVFRHLQSANNVSKRSSEHPRAFNINNLVAANHVAAKHNPALPKKGRKRHNVVGTSLQSKPARCQVLVPKSHLQSKKLGTDPKATSHSSRYDTH
jgi:hypothetical protein